jgi:hypothetical protein
VPLDGILVVKEVVDDNKRMNKELIIFRAKFEKAYDLVDWSTIW